MPTKVQDTPTYMLRLFAFSPQREFEYFVRKWFTPAEIQSFITRAVALYKQGQKDYAHLWTAFSEKGGRSYIVLAKEVGYRVCLAVRSIFCFVIGALPLVAAKIASLLLPLKNNTITPYCCTNPTTIKERNSKMNQFQVLSLNTGLFPTWYGAKPILGDARRKHREEIVQDIATYYRRYDVICLQEVHEKEDAQYFQKQLMNPKFFKKQDCQKLNKSQVVRGGAYQYFLWKADSGLFIMSKCELSKWTFTAYEAYSGKDGWLNKGVCAVRVHITKENTFALINTQLNEPMGTIQDRQITQLSKIMEGYVQKHTSDCLIVCGGLMKTLPQNFCKDAMVFDRVRIMARHEDKMVICYYNAHSKILPEAKKVSSNLGQPRLCNTFTLLRETLSKSFLAGVNSMTTNLLQYFLPLKPQAVPPLPVPVTKANKESRSTPYDDAGQC